MAALFTYQPWCKNFKVNLKSRHKKKLLKLNEVNSCWSHVDIWKIIKSTHTHIQTKKKFFFLNILKIFQNTIEVYEKIFKVECTKHKPIGIWLNLHWSISFQVKIRKKNEM